MSSMHSVVVDFEIPMLSAIVCVHSLSKMMHVTPQLL